MAQVVEPKRFQITDPALKKLLLGLSWLLYLCSFIFADYAYLFGWACVPVWAFFFKSIHARVAEGGKVAGVSFLFGMLVSIPTLIWMGQFAYNWTKISWVGLIPVGVISLIFGGYWMFAGWISSLLIKRDKGWALPIVWTGLEILRCYIPVLAFPWTFVANNMVFYRPLIQHAAYGSIFLVSFTVYVLANGIAQFGKTPKMKTSTMDVGKFQIGLALALFGLSLVREATFDPQKLGVRVAMGQVNVDLAYGDSSVEEDKIRVSALEHYSKAKEAKADLLVLPEGLARVPTMPPTPPFAVEAFPPVLFGGQRGNSPSYQTAFSFDGKAWSFADKTRLVVFGEFIPFRGIIPYPPQLNLPGGDLVPGDKLTTLTLGKLRVGPVLCFEALFPDIPFRHKMQGAQLIAVMSVDDWYMDTQAIEMLRAASIWRAIETGLPVARVGPTGRTCAIDPKGNVLSELPLQQRGTLIADF